MAEDYQAFLDYDWTDERWESYLGGLYPPPTGKQTLKFKKKWYKKNIDTNFDDTYEPPSAAPSSSSSASAGNSSYTTPAAAFQAMHAQGEGGERWAKMGPKALICFLAYVVALVLSAAAVAQVFPPYQALIVLVGAFVLEVLAKYGIKFKTEYVQKLLLDENDVGVMPMMLLTLLTPGLHPVVRTMALAPPTLTALMSISSIAKNYPKLPKKVKEFFEPLSGVSARYQLKQIRADVEVFLGVILVVAVLAMRAAPISALLFWNFMMMRYMMNSWTQATFRKIDGALDPMLGSLPLVGRAYAALKRTLYSFVDPDKKKGSSWCSIL